MGLISSLFIALAVCAALGITLSIVVVLMVRRGGPRVDRPSCGKCLYCVEGLSTMTCPECGSDLREVGIVTPSKQVAVSPLIWILLWTLLLPLPALFLSRLAYVATPVSYNHDRYVRLRPQSSENISEVQLTLWSHDTDAQPAYRWVLVELRDADGSIGQPLLVNLETDQWRVGGTDNDQLNDAPVLPEHVAGWLSDELNDGSEQQFMDMSDALLGHVATAAAMKPMVLGEHFATVNINAVTTQQRPGWITPVAAAFWIMVWLAGVWLITRRAVRARRKSVESKSRIIDLASK